MNLNNLVICVTPFQMLLANKLISQIGQRCDILVLSYIDSTKYRYYFNLLKSNKLVRNSNFFHLKGFKIKNYFNLQKKFRKECYDKVMFASINDFFIHSILGFLKEFNTIHTFDDGTANIFKNSFYYKRNRESLFRRVFSAIFNSWDMDKVKKSSAVHYTIYPNISNIINNTRDINLFKDISDMDSLNIIGDGIEYIFLGQPFDDSEFSSKIFLNMKTLIPSIRYYTHPRENIDDIIRYGVGEENIISSELLVEDYIYQILATGKLVYVYSICSSAAFNIAFWRDVSVHLIKTNVTYNEFKELYEIAGNLRIDILNINE